MGDNTYVLVARADITKGHGPGALATDIYSSQSWRLESEVKVSAELIPPEAFLLGVEMAISSLCPQMVVPVCVSVSSSPLLIRTPILLD